MNTIGVRSCDLRKELLDELETITKKYKTRESSILNCLSFVQERKGFISIDTEKEIAEFLNVSVSKVHEVATFYTMFFLNQKGKYLIQVCRSISCSILNSESILDFIKNKLKINVNETSPDKKFTLINVECLGACGNAPVVRINKTYYENLTPEKINDILDNLP